MLAIVFQKCDEMSEMHLHSYKFVLTRSQAAAAWMCNESREFEPETLSAFMYENLIYMYVDRNH